jgi:hypothetical protein
VITKAVLGGLSYLGKNPLFVVEAARHAARLELSLPMDLLRWAIERRPRKKGPERIELGAADGALSVELTVDLYGTKIDVACRIEVESIENLPGELKLALRVRGLDVRAPAGSPAAMFVKSLDLSQPANLMSMMPQKHAALVEAKGDRFVLDLMKIPKLARNKMLARLLGGLSFVAIRDVRTEGDLLIVGFSVRPLEIPTALERVRRS